MPIDDIPVEIYFTKTINIKAEKLTLKWLSHRTRYNIDWLKTG